MSRVAVIGSGISGLATAWLLSRTHDVLLFEREPRPGGHTHTHHVDTPDGRLALDTGFLVHNTRTYPLLVRLFEELGVETLDSDMTFGVTEPSTGFEFGTSGLGSLFADRRNLLRPGHYRLLLDIARFNAASRRLVAASRLDKALESVPLGQWFREERLSGEVVDRFLVPLASAIWSTGPGDMLAFPAVTLARFFDHHGMNTILDHPKWRVVAGGSSTYIPKLLASPRVTLSTSAPVASVRRATGEVSVTLADGTTIPADHVVFACHGDQVLPLLSDATVVEREVFSGFATTANRAILHDDESWLPRRKAARAAWNYRLSNAGSSTARESGAATVTYDLTRLEQLKTSRAYLVTLNPDVPIPAERILRSLDYRHPLYTARAIASQARWGEVSGRDRTHFAGAYWFYGFHEDGLRSAVRVAETLGVTW